MKQVFRMGAIGGLVFAAMAASAQKIPVTVNGNQVNFRGQGPVMSGARVLVPLRGVLEQMGATVRWDPSNQTVHANKEGTRVTLHIGERTASVNGSPVSLDVPAQIINGSTMVPLRFVGEALGEHVHWDAQQQMVDITTGGYDIPSNQVAMRPKNQRPLVIRQSLTLRAGTVIPVTLDQSLSSDYNHRGDGFTATVRRGADGLPSGTKVDGLIEGVRAQTDDRPGMLELRFDRLQFPDGKTYTINGSLSGLGSQYVDQRGDRWMAVRSEPQRMAFAGLGSGNGLIVGVVTERPIEQITMQNMRDLGAARNLTAHNVHLHAGDTFGVRLRNELPVRSRDLR